MVQSYDPTLLGRLVATRFLGFTCDSCTYCLRGLQTSCPRQVNLPKDVQGTFREYANIPTSCLLPLPQELESIPSADLGDEITKYCAALCSGSTALRALRTANNRPGDVVIVVGAAGGIGHLIGMMARQVFGLKVIAVDRASQLRKLPTETAKLLAHTFIQAPEILEKRESALHEFRNQLFEACSRLRGGSGIARGAESIIVAASKISAFWGVEDYVCDGGNIVCVG